MKIPLSPPPFATVLHKINDLQKILDGQPLIAGLYLHWDQLRNRQPPNGLTHEEWWAA
jgi:hypothetical protein